MPQPERPAALNRTGKSSYRDTQVAGLFTAQFAQPWVALLLKSGRGAANVSRVFIRAARGGEWSGWQTEDNADWKR